MKDAKHSQRKRRPSRPRSAHLDAEERRIRELLENLIRLMGRQRSDLERELGLGPGGVSKILRGTVKLQFTHIIALLDLLDFAPADFFEIAYGGQPAGKSADKGEASTAADADAQAAAPRQREALRQALAILLRASVPKG